MDTRNNLTTLINGVPLTEQQLKDGLAAIQKQKNALNEQERAKLDRSKIRIAHVFTEWACDSRHYINIPAAVVDLITARRKNNPGADYITLSVDGSVGHNTHNKSISDAPILKGFN